MRISIKHKLTGFIVLLLLTNLLILSFLTLRGIKANQQSSIESYLKERSKTANLYIREKYLESNQKDFEAFCTKQANELIIEIERILDMRTSLYDMQGNKLGNELFKVKSNANKDIMAKALDNKITYKKVGNKIIYMAPIYGFNDQIGVIQFEYSLQLHYSLNEDTKKLFIIFGFISIMVTFIIGRTFFIGIANRILYLKEAVQSIKSEQSNTDVSCIRSKDEIEDLAIGIGNMTNRIQENINALEKEKNKLQKLEKKQKEFIGNITHEFKTPIAIIKTHVDLITMYDDDEVLASKSKEVIGHELNRLNGMVENILHLSSLEKYDFEIKNEVFDTADILNDLIDKLKGKAKKYGIKFYSQLEPCQVQMDKDSFVMIFINLLDNAIKYNSTSGEIHVKSVNMKGFNRIEIMDTGIGILDEHKEKIFDPFYTVDKNKSKKLSGTGLGLSLVKKMLIMQDASISVRDSEAGGTVFEIDIPVKGI